MRPTRQGGKTKKAATAKKTTAKKTTAKKAIAKKAAAKKTTAKKAAAKDELPVLSFAKQDAWSEWLAKHHASSRGVRLKFARKASGIPSITYQEALEVALMWGWIDGQGQRFNDTFWLQRYTPRGPRSIWSKINRERALALIASGKMKPAGLEQVERAKKDGRWEAAYDSPRSATVPDDLAAALAANPRAAEFFATLDARNRYAVLFRTHHAKKAETRARRIATFVEMLARHEKLHP
ncbi:YdeI/OmpD-associated family protein [Hyalangium minutum]|uniref:Putative periplasmic membrane protein n=1 Tax=Hyalangium minutum TaxID=394096 RepID=A0A085WIL7_9BACT|nr:YdeI/OmpD-associated family protein [Hyalangium minutum]KFE67530.1 putative periplasmic membrane protein [Hyalangium minutum]